MGGEGGDEVDDGGDVGDPVLDGVEEDDRLQVGEMGVRTNFQAMKFE